VTPVVENAFTADIKRLQDTLTADQAGELTRLADGLSKTRTPGAIAGDISEAINTDGLKAVVEFKIIRNRLAKIGTPDQVQALDEAVLSGVSERTQEQLKDVFNPDVAMSREKAISLEFNIDPALESETLSISANQKTSPTSANKDDSDQSGETSHPNETDFHKINNMTPEASKEAREEAASRIAKIDERKRLADINASLQDDPDTPIEKRLRREPAFQERIRELQETGKTDNIELRAFIEQYGSLFGIDNPGNFDFPRTDEIGNPTKISRNALSRRARDIPNVISGQEFDYGQRNKLRVAAADEELAKSGVSKETISRFSKSERYALDFALQGNVDDVGIPPFMINEQKIAKQFQKDLERGKSITEATENALKLKSNLGPNPIVDAVIEGNKDNKDDLEINKIQPRNEHQENDIQVARANPVQRRIESRARLRKEAERRRIEKRDKDLKERDRLNYPLPSSAEDAGKMDFILLPLRESKYHQNHKGKPELKYIHPDGREVVFDGDTGNMITAPETRGSFNYGPKTWTLDHFTKDMLPYYSYRKGGIFGLPKASEPRTRRHRIRNRK